MPSDDEKNIVELTVAPEPEPKQPRADSGEVARVLQEPRRPGTSRAAVIVDSTDNQLVVPPELLANLTPDQISKVLDLEEARGQREFARLMKELEYKQRSQSTAGFVVLLGTLLVVFVVGVLAYRAQYEWAMKILVPIGTAVAGYIAGRGQGKGGAGI